MAKSISPKARVATGISELVPVPQVGGGHCRPLLGGHYCMDGEGRRKVGSVPLSEVGSRVRGRSVCLGEKMGETGDGAKGSAVPCRVGER